MNTKKILDKIEKESILHLLSDECTPHEIAQELNISERYVNNVIEEYNFIQDRWSECEHND